jgi:hypothetical protein
MAGTAHFFPNFQQSLATASGGARLVGTVDTLKIGLVATGSTFNWVAATEAYTTVSSFLTNAGSGGGGALTEVSGGSYARQTLTGVALTQSANVNTLTASSPINFPTATANYSASYAFIYDYTAGANSDTAGLMVCYWDFGGPLAVVTGGNIALTVNASGLVTWTAS